MQKSETKFLQNKKSHPLIKTRVFYYLDLILTILR